MIKITEQEPKTKFTEKIFKGKKPGKDQFLICILTGILLIIIAMPTAKSKGSSATEKSILQSASPAKALADTQKEQEILPTEGEIESVEEYERYMENKLEQAIAAMEGAGKVKVMVTVAASKELVVAKDTPAKSNHTVETDSDGGSRDTDESEDGEETVYSKAEDGSSSPYVIKTLQPVVKGVVVIAQGGNRPEVNKNITEAIVALFDIEPHKIKVVKMKSE